MSQRAHIIERGNVAVMGNILKIIVQGHLELSHPLEGLSDKLLQWRFKKMIYRDNQFKAIEK